MSPPPITWELFKQALFASLDADPVGTLCIIGLPVVMTLGLLLFPVICNWNYFRVLLWPRHKVALSVKYGTWRYNDSDAVAGFRDETLWILFAQVEGKEIVELGAGRDAELKVEALLAKGYFVQGAELMLQKINPGDN